MKPALAKAPDANTLEDLGRATLQIVHDLKNQLNGLKLYATFLRKRLDRHDQAAEERETLAKLIAGLDRAARDMTALVRYAQPLDLRRQAHTDLREIISNAVREAALRITGPLGEPITCDIEPGTFYGDFDPPALTEAFAALTAEAFGTRASKNAANASIGFRKADSSSSPEALIEWRGVKQINHQPGSETTRLGANVHTNLAARVISAHGGRIEFDKDVIRVWLPLSD